MRTYFSFDLVTDASPVVADALVQHGKALNAALAAANWNGEAPYTLLGNERTINEWWNALMLTVHEFESRGSFAKRCLAGAGWQAVVEKAEY